MIQIPNKALSHILPVLDIYTLAITPTLWGAIKIDRPFVHYWVVLAFEFYTKRIQIRFAVGQGAELGTESPDFYTN